MYNWKLRLSRKYDIAIVIFFWSVSLFTIFANLIVYSVFTPYDLYGYQGGNIEGGVSKAITTTLILIPICIIVSILMGNDRLITRRNAQIQKLDESKFELPDLNFKRRNILRLILMGIIIFFSLPWILAIVGIYISDIPGINKLFLGRQPYPNENGYPSVHLGAHHGYRAFLFAIMAITLSTSLDSEYFLKNKLIRHLVLCGILFLSFYAIFAGVEDFINEQLIKRGLDVPIYLFFKVIYNSVFFYPFIAILAILITFLLYCRTSGY